MIFLWLKFAMWLKMSIYACKWINRHILKYKTIVPKPLDRNNQGTASAATLDSFVGLARIGESKTLVDADLDLALLQHSEQTLSMPPEAARIT